MPPRATKLGNLAGLLGSDSEPEFDSILSTAASAINDVKRPRGRPPSAVKASKPAPRRLSSGVTKPAQPSRRVLKDKSNKNAAIEDEDSGKDVKSGRGRASKQQSNAKTTGTGSRTTVTGPKRGRPGTKTSKTTQEETAEAEENQEMDIDIEVEEYEELIAELDAPSEQELEEDVPEVTMDIDASDSTLRRRLGDLTRKYDSLESRHRKLQEVGVKEAERNYDRLRKQSEENTSCKHSVTYI